MQKNILFKFNNNQKIKMKALVLLNYCYYSSYQWKFCYIFLERSVIHVVMAFIDNKMKFYLIYHNIGCNNLKII